jgi:hypothetical protein
MVWFSVEVEGRVQAILNCSLMHFIAFVKEWPRCFEFSVGIRSRAR